MIGINYLYKYRKIVRSRKDNQTKWGITVNLDSQFAILDFIIIIVFLNDYDCTSQVKGQSGPIRTMGGNLQGLNQTSIPGNYLEKWRDL